MAIFLLFNGLNGWKCSVPRSHRRVQGMREEMSGRKAWLTDLKFFDVIRFDL